MALKGAGERSCRVGEGTRSILGFPLVVNKGETLRWLGFSVNILRKTLKICVLGKNKQHNRLYITQKLLQKMHTSLLVVGSTLFLK